MIKSLYVFDDTKGNNVLFVTLNDKVFGFGSNSYGVCGFGHQMVVNEPKIIEELCDKSVIQFHNGIGSAFALTSDNKLYGWVNNEFGQLGVKIINNSKIYKPILIEDLNHVIIEQISCGLTHTLVLSSEGEIYGWGDNRYGQIGCGKELGENISVVTQLNKLPKIKSIHCSCWKSFALTDNGMVYSWGKNGFVVEHQTIYNVERFSTPKLIENFGDIIFICSSRYNTYFLSSDGIIYFCGYYDKNGYYFYQIFPKFFISIIKSLIYSLYSKDSFKEDKSVTALLINETIYEIESNTIEKTDYKSLDEFYLMEYNITHQTIDMNNEEFIDNKAWFKTIPNDSKKEISSG